VLRKSHGFRQFDFAALDDVSFRADKGKFVVRPGFAELPAANITHAGARAYCRWRGGDLPTEAQWERAARGPERRTYPWGNETPTCDRAVYGVHPMDSKQSLCPGSGVPLVAAASETSDRTKEGVMHMGGNVSEWVIDQLVADGYARCKSPCDDQPIDSQTLLE
jgi:formylglycine-generating enzyme required for sulfatase activity